MGGKKKSDQISRAYRINTILISSLLVNMQWSIQGRWEARKISGNTKGTAKRNWILPTKENYFGARKRNPAWREIYCWIFNINFHLLPGTKPVFLCFPLPVGTRRLGYWITIHMKTCIQTDLMSLLVNPLSPVSAWQTKVKSYIINEVSFPTRIIQISGGEWPRAKFLAFFSLSLTSKTPAVLDNYNHHDVLAQKSLLSNLVGSRDKFRKRVNSRGSHKMVEKWLLYKQYTR